MTIRHATMGDLDIITLIETTSFHKTEAAKKEEIKERIQLNGDFFWLLDDFGEVLAFVHGFPTNAENLSDDMFHSPEQYDNKAQLVADFVLDFIGEGDRVGIDVFRPGEIEKALVNRELLYHRRIAAADVLERLRAGGV